MAATTKLIVWNAALREIGAAPLADTTTANKAQYELNGAWDHAIEHTLARMDWNFARRRASLTGVSSAAFPPYIYRYTKPDDYLRKVWIKVSAEHEYQADHAEIAAAFYGMQPLVLIEYMSDHADNYEPANWPPHFTRVLTLYLASLIAPSVARAGADNQGMLDGKMQSALADADEQEALFLTNVTVPTNRQPVMRRALEFIGHALSGSVPVHAQADKLRWHMMRAWDHSLKWVLEQGAWNFASRRALLTGGLEPIPGGEAADIIEGYAVGPATEEASTDVPDMAGYDYGFLLPSGFLHKIWIKADANHDQECRHQFLGSAVYTNTNPCVMEYVAWDADSTNPANWSASFTEAVAAYLALTISPELVVQMGAKGSIKVDGNAIRQKLEAVYAERLSNAKLRDAIQQDAVRMPAGRFAMARAGGSRSLVRH